MGRLKATAHHLQQALRREWRSVGIALQDRAHLATTGGRPFLACRPCMPADLVDGAAIAANPAARPKTTADPVPR